MLKKNNSQFSSGSHGSRGAELVRNNSTGSAGRDYEAAQQNQGLIAKNYSRPKESTFNWC